MEIDLQIEMGPDSRFTGTVRPTGTSQWTAFTGNLELIGCLEQLCLPSDPRTPEIGRLQ